MKLGQRIVVGTEGWEGYPFTGSHGRVTHIIKSGLEGAAAVAGWNIGVKLDVNPAASFVTWFSELELRDE